MVYVDGYVLPIKKAELKYYKKMAKDGARIWVRHGALRYIESVQDDVSTVKKWKGAEFPKLAGCKKDEVVVFAFVLYKDKKHRDLVNKKVMKDPEMSPDKYKHMPFEMSRMAYAGFKILVDSEK